jgi:hypothetical protein
VQQLPRVLAGNNVQASQQYVSSRVHWFTGAFFGQLFQIDPDYGAHIPLLTFETPLAEQAQNGYSRQFQRSCLSV